jgi:uncharacterized protein
MKPIIKKIAKEFKAELQKIYGDDLADLILFGSQARGDSHSESDIDFAVVLKNPNTTSTSEIRKLSDIGSELSVKYGELVTFIGMPENKLRESEKTLYENIRKEGIRV